MHQQRKKPLHLQPARKHQLAGRWQKLHFTFLSLCHIIMVIVVLISTTAHIEPYGMIWYGWEASIKGRKTKTTQGQLVEQKATHTQQIYEMHMVYTH
jgi:uncharacterized protein YpmS